MLALFKIFPREDRLGGGMALSFMLGNNPSALQVGMKAGLLSGLETDGQWYQFGYDTDNWQRHAAYGFASGTETCIRHDR